MSAQQNTLWQVDRLFVNTFLPPKSNLYSISTLQYCAAGQKKISSFKFLKSGFWKRDMLLVQESKKRIWKIETNLVYWGSAQVIHWEWMRPIVYLFQNLIYYLLKTFCKLLIPITKEAIRFVACKMKKDYFVLFTSQYVHSLDWIPKLFMGFVKIPIIAKAVQSKFASLSTSSPH